MAVNDPPGMIYAIRETPLLTDFYAEITAEINFCQPGDEYGLMVRVENTRLGSFSFCAFRVMDRQKLCRFMAAVAWCLSRCCWIP